MIPQLQPIMAQSQASPIFAITEKLRPKGATTLDYIDFDHQRVHLCNPVNPDRNKSPQTGYVIITTG